jgi:hypothetical protein
MKLPDGKIYVYTDVIAVRRLESSPFSSPGDSGSLVYTEDGLALGLIIGATDELTYVSPMEKCLKEIEAELL